MDRKPFRPRKPFLSPNGLGKLGSEQSFRYRELFRTHLEAGMVHAIRDSTNQELVLGRDDFKDRIEQMIARKTRPGKSGRPRTLGVGEPVADYYVY